MTTAKDLAANVTVTKTFYLKQGRIPSIFVALREMLKDQTSGKFARKAARVKRAFATAVEEFQAQADQLLEMHKKMFEDGPKQGTPVPVYRTIRNEKTGEDVPVFVKDDAGNDTNERESIPGTYFLKDEEAYKKDYKEFINEIVEIRCPAFTEDDWNKFSKITGTIVDELMDLDEDGPATIPPEGFESAKPAIALMPDAADDAAEEHSTP